MHTADTCTQTAKAKASTCKPSDSDSDLALSQCSAWARPLARTGNGDLQGSTHTHCAPIPIFLSLFRYGRRRGGRLRQQQQLHALMGLNRYGARCRFPYQNEICWALRRIISHNLTCRAWAPLPTAYEESPLLRKQIGQTHRTHEYLQERDRPKEIFAGKLGGSGSQVTGRQM